MNNIIDILGIDEKDIKIVAIASTLAPEKLILLKGIVIGLQLQKEQKLQQINQLIL